MYKVTTEKGFAIFGTRKELDSGNYKVSVISSTEERPFFVSNYTPDGKNIGGQLLTKLARDFYLDKLSENGADIKEVDELWFLDDMQYGA